MQNMFVRAVSVAHEETVLKGQKSIELTSANKDPAKKSDHSVAIDIKPPSKHGSGSSSVKPPIRLDSIKLVTDPKSGAKPNMDVIDGSEEKQRNSVRLACDRLASDWRFKSFIIGIIVLNTLLLASERHGQSDMWTYFLEISNLVFTILFALEMAIKLVGFGWHRYVADSFNIFDAILVTLSILEVILDEVCQLGECHTVSGGGWSAFRAVRLLRVFKLARSWTQLQILLNTVLKSFKSLMNFMLIFALFMFIYSLIGMQMMGAKGVLKSRATFDTFWWSLITVFQVIGGENWNEAMYDG
eukprot:797481_1